MVTQVVERLPWNGVEVWLTDTWDMLYTIWFMDWGLLLLAVASAAIMTILRAILNFVLLDVSSMQPACYTIEGYPLGGRV